MKSWEEILKPIVEKAIDAAEKTGEFVVDQAPIVLQEFYAWHLWSSVFYIVLAIVIYLMGRYVPHIWISEKFDEEKHELKFFGRGLEDDYDDLGVFWGWAIYFSAFLLALVMFCNNLLSLIKILVAPRLYLIEYFL